MVSAAVRNFVKQQGFPDTPESSCSAQYRALSFQPMMTAPLVVIGIIFQSAALFLVLAVIQWWNVLVPRANPFDLLYNTLFGSRPGAVRLTPAPAPRRFSMGMSASFMLGVGVSLVMGWMTAAIVLEVFLCVALTAIILGKFCLGSYIYHLVTGKASFANRTLPWSQG